MHRLACMQDVDRIHSDGEMVLYTMLIYMQKSYRKLLSVCSAIAQKEDE